MPFVRRSLLALAAAFTAAAVSVSSATDTPFVAPPANAQAAAEEARTAELVGVELQRIAALVAGDVAQLDQILATEVTFGHADGRLESKADLIDGIRTGRQRYHAIQAGERRVSLLHEDAATISGTADLLVGPAGAPFKLRVRYLAVYQRTLRLGWQLVAYQSTRLPAE